MPNARKGADLRRDPRFALHSPTVDPTDGEQYRADIAEVVHTHLDEAATKLVVQWWTPLHGLRRVER